MLRHSKIVTGLCIAALLAGAELRPVRAQVLADKVPEDALVYAGWAGGDALGSAYDGSHLKTFLETLNLPAFVGDRFTQALAGSTDAQRAQRLKLAQELLTSIGHAPTALYIGPLDVAADPARPAPRIALLSQVGAVRAQSLAGPLNDALQANRQPGQPAAGIVAAGEFLLLYVGDANIQDRLTAAAPAHALADADLFKKAMARVATNADPAVATLYIDGQAAAETLAGAVQGSPNAQARQLFPALADGLGLNNLQQFAWAGNFDHAGWQARTFLGMRDRRPGLLAFFDNGPLSQESLKLIPRSATSARAFRFDGMRLLNDVTSTAARLNDQAPKQIESALTTIYVWSGIDLKRELLPAFGDEFVYYATPESAGNSLRGFTLANRLRDSKKGDAAVSAIENFFNELVAQRNPRTKLQFATQMLPAPWDKVTAHIMPLQNFSPCWAVNDGVFLFSLSLQGLQSALDMTGGNKPSILDNPQFLAARNKLGRENFAAFSYADLEKSAPETYELVQRVLTTAQARSPGVPSYALPPLGRITPALGPALKVSWTDAEGYHAAETSPFPMARYLSPGAYVGLLVAQQLRQEARVPAPAVPPTALP